MAISWLPFQIYDFEHFKANTILLLSLSVLNNTCIAAIERVFGILALSTQVIDFYNLFQMQRILLFLSLARGVLLAKVSPTNA